MKLKKKENIKILVATHKKYKMPNNKIYLPIQVGAEGKEDLGYEKDNVGENISSKNPNYCELTAMYWAWKNLKCDIIGLNHYRRYFTLNDTVNSKTNNYFNYILNEKEINNILKDFDIIISRKKKLYLKNVRQNYKQQHYEKDLDITREVIKELYPSYIKDFDITMEMHKMCICNMFVMSKEDFDKYCEWLFKILFEVEKRTDIRSYSVLQKRIFGFISERLFNVWLVHNKSLKVKEVRILSLEVDNLKTILKKSYRRILGIKS